MEKGTIYLAIMSVLVIALAVAGYILLHPDKAIIPADNTTIVKVPFHNATNAVHPFLLFHHIADTPGYQYRDADPWMSWQQSVLDSANSSLSTDFSSRWAGDYVSVRAEDARDLALAYQITGNTTYAEKAQEALLNMDLGDAPDAQKNMSQLLGYCLAYDWVQPYLSADEDATIRDDLATLADRAYQGLNYYNTRRSLIKTVDYHMQWYPIVGIAGITLNDYTNPHNLSLASGPYEWQQAGTSDLFVNDTLHVYKKPLVSFQWDGEGNDLLGSYKMYYTDDFMWWAQVYSYYYGQDFFDVYPATKKAFLSEIMTSLPDRYANNFAADGNVLYTYQGAFENLLDEENRSIVQGYLESVNGGLLPYSRTLISEDAAGPGLLYCTYQNYSDVQPKQPSRTSLLSNNSSYQVFRESWANDSEWMGLVTYGVNTLSNRNNAHHDQLSFEYYGRGDLLLADAGENRLVLDKNYGAYELSHNTVAIEDPRSPFSLSPWGNNTARGIFKGSGDSGLVTPAHIENIVDAPWMELVDTNVSVKSVINDSQYTGMNLSSKISYERCVLFPEKEYFIVVDRMDGSQAWTYDTIFRPTSLSIVPTEDKNGDKEYTADEVGHVNGNLTVGNTSLLWQYLPYKTVTSTGQDTSRVQWSTTNPYGRDVQLMIYTVPSSEVLTEKYVGRIAGYNAQNEVYSPDVIFRSKPSTSIYRATVLLSKYSSEPQKLTGTLPVTGNGNAMVVEAMGYTDYIYTGAGSSSFGYFSTDANVLFVRDIDGGIADITMLDGKSVYRDGKPVVEADSNLDYLTLKKDDGGITLKVKAMKATKLSLYLTSGRNIMVDGMPYAQATSGNGGITLEITAGEHILQIQ